MLNTQDRSSKEKINPRLEQNLHDFLKSLGDVLIDITALEVNTIVVEQITGDIFIPWQVYRDVYPISKQYLEGNRVHPLVRDRYLHLRQKLEIEYCLLLIEDNPSAFHDCRILTDPSVTLDEIQTKLPNPLNPAATPSEIRKIQNLLEDSRFLRKLRQIYELKTAIDNQNQALITSESASNSEKSAFTTDVIQAQTVIHLDGKIVNRFDKKLLDGEYKELILNLHKEGVIAGEAYWRGLLEFVVNFTQSILAQPGSIKSLFARN